MTFVCEYCQEINKQAVQAEILVLEEENIELLKENKELRNQVLDYQMKVQRIDRDRAVASNGAGRWRREEYEPRPKLPVSLQWLRLQLKNNLKSALNHKEAKLFTVPPLHSCLSFTFIISFSCLPPLIIILALHCVQSLLSSVAHDDHHKMSNYCSRGKKILQPSQ
jgi:hypothetical protein